MRPVTPAMFIRLPARMKNGTASSGKLSTPAIMRWATITSGTMPVDEDVEQRGDRHGQRHRQAEDHQGEEGAEQDAASASAAHGRVEGLGALEHRIAAPPVGERDLDRSAANISDEADEDAA